MQGRIRMLSVIGLLSLSCLQPQLHAQLYPEWITSGSGGFTFLHIVRGMDGCAGGYYLTGGMEDNSCMLQNSNDGGETWTPTLEVKRYGFGQLQPPIRQPYAEVVIQSVCRPTPDRCYAYGWGSMEFDGLQQPLLLRSVDSGRTWTDVILPDSGQGVTMAWLAMRDGTHGIRSGGFIDMDHPVLYRTNDGGDSWETIELPFADYRVTGLEYAADGTLFAVEWQNDRPLYRSTDNGDSWEMRGILPARRDPFFISADLGWMAFGIDTGLGDVERDGIARTTDGGASWQMVMDTLVEPAFGLIAIAAATEDEVIAVGRLGKLLHSHDGGDSWERAPRPFYLYDPAMVEVVFPDTSSAVAGALKHIVTYTGRRTLPSPVVTIDHGSGDLDFTARWTAVPGATEYQLEMTRDYHTSTIQYEIFDTDPYMQGQWMTPTMLDLAFWLQVNRDYFVRVRARGGGYTSDWSAPVKFYTEQSTSVATSAATNFTLDVYPQPCKDGQLHINIEDLAPASPWSITIHDLLGRCVMRTQGMSSADGTTVSDLNLHAVTAGIYLLHFKSGERHSSMRMVLD
ncbi:T9SS type A sorting domain-containing protein [bacterium]|nr:T9SS type A sorting domain-containing protein [bacterium]